MKLYTTDIMSEATLTPSTENTEFPATNVQNYQPTRRWYTLGTGTAETLVIDLGSAVTADTFIVAGHNFDGTETNVKIQGNATDSWGAPTVDETLTVVVDQPFKKKFSSNTLRFWRFIFTKANSTDIKQVGRLWLGEQIDTGSLGDPDYGGATLERVDRSIVDKSIGGQSYIEVKQKYETFTLDLTKVPESVFTTYYDEFDTLGVNTPYFIEISTISPLDRLYYVRNTSDLGRKVEAYDSEFHWNTRLDLEEII